METHKFQKISTTFIIAACGILAVAQNQISEADMPQAWQYESHFDQESPVDDGWWHQFDDRKLDSLIAAGVANNYNVAMAVRRIEMANQALRQTRAAYFPQFNLNASWTKARNSGMMTSHATPATNMSYFDLGVNMNWQIDIFGKITSRAKQGKATVDASRAEYDGMMVTVAAKIASTYFQLRAVQGEIEVTNRHIASQKRVMEITEARKEAGLASQLDVSQAATTYYSTLASVTSLQSTETSLINGIAVLLGVFPEQIDASLRQIRPMPEYNQIVTVGVPMDLLRRRPDVREAEYTLAGYAAALGIAKKDFLPTLSLNGSIGTEAHNIGDMFKRQSIGYSIAPTLSWTIFDGLGRKSAVDQAKQQMMAGIDNYNLTIITAVQEVENAMAAYRADLESIDYLGQVVEEAHEALRLSIDLYKQGLTTFINVTNAQITLLQYANQLVLAQGQALADLVTLYEALGGGIAR